LPLQKFPVENGSIVQAKKSFPETEKETPLKQRTQEKEVPD